MERPIVLFDGVCNFCNATVNFLIDRDPHHRLRFAALQSESGQRLQTQFGIVKNTLDTLVLIEGDQVYTRSTAALQLCLKLCFPWPLCAGLLVIPRPLRDWAYTILARNRYRWFGRSAVCRVPTATDRDRFV